VRNEFRQPVDLANDANARLAEKAGSALRRRKGHMPDYPLLDQAEQLLAHYPEDTDAHRILRAVIDGARNDNIPEDVMDEAVRLRDQLPNSTISLTIQRIFYGHESALTKESLERWIAATEAERKPD
jgi:hypothetical protein